MRNIESYTKEYLKPNFEDYQLKYRRKKILEILNRFPHQRILEIGCGMEPLFQYLDSEQYEKYMVIEPGEAFFRNAISMAAGNEKVICVNEYFDVSEEVKKFDADFIICSSLLHELEHPSDFLCQIYQVCGSDAIVHLNVPNANSVHRILAKHMGKIQDLHELTERNVLYQQNSVYDLVSLEELAVKCGFKVLEKGSFFIKPFTHGQMYQMLEHGIVDEKVLDGLYGLEAELSGFGSEIYVNMGVEHAEI